RRAARRKRDDARLVTVAVVKSEAVIVRVGDNEVAFAVQPQAAGPALAVVGHREGDAQVLAVQVERLHARGEIDDPKAVFSVNDGGAWADEVAVLHALFAPDDLRPRRGAAATGEAQHGEDKQRTHRRGTSERDEIQAIRPARRREVPPSRSGKRTPTGRAAPPRPESGATPCCRPASASSTRTATGSLRRS